MACFLAVCNILNFPHHLQDCRCHWSNKMPTTLLSIFFSWAVMNFCLSCIYFPFGPARAETLVNTVLYGHVSFNTLLEYKPHELRLPSCGNVDADLMTAHSSQDWTSRNIVVSACSSIHSKDPVSRVLGIEIIVVSQNTLTEAWFSWKTFYLSEFHSKIGRQLSTNTGSQNYFRVSFKTYIIVRLFSPLTLCWNFW